MLQSKTNQWGHAGTTEYALERSIPPPLYCKKNRARPLEQYRGNVNLSDFIESWEPSQVRPVERECRVVQQSLEEGDSKPRRRWLA